MAHGRVLYHVSMHLNRVTVHVLEHFKDSPAIKTQRDRGGAHAGPSIADRCGRF
jgi:hypothetical protein